MFLISVVCAVILLKCLFFSSCPLPTVDLLSAEALWDKPYGGANTEGCDPVLRLCDRKAESTLP